MTIMSESQTHKTMVRHFETKKQAWKYQEGQHDNSLHTYKKIKGMKNRGKKPFVVCTELEWLNLY